MLQPHIFCELESFLQLDVMVIYNSYFRSAATGDDLLKPSGITQNRPVRVTSKPANGESSGH
jgi:hypothetical protein